MADLLPELGHSFGLQAENLISAPGTVLLPTR
jgi:hypothetical protein